MVSVTVELGARSYTIRIGSGLLSDRRLLASEIRADQVLIVTNAVVASLYAERLQASLGGREIAVCVLPDGEQHKTLATFATIIDRLIESRFRRDCCIVALGGGVVGDVAGFAAASYQRGVDYVQVPTTLLAQVDSSVGGKTAVNHPSAKNMIGAFHQPKAVIADTATLATLPRRELGAGIAEIIKYGLIADADLFAWLEEHVEDLLALDEPSLEHAIERSCAIKAEIVAEDEREKGKRALLNYGHTFGHALESIGRYERWLHGEAVAIGMEIAANVSAELGWLGKPERERVSRLLSAARLPRTAPGVAAEDVLAHLQLDKKVAREGVRLVLLKGIGRAVVTPAPERAALRAAIERQLH
ncbi:MAG TPA: 3-dehydroquinate synthase [Gammaproteobacteria bacterium]